MDFSPNTMNSAIILDQSMINFFHRAENYNYIEDPSTGIRAEFYLIKDLIEQDLENFKFDSVAINISKLINKINKTIDLNIISKSLLTKISIWIKNLLRDLGFVYEQNINSSVSDLMALVISTRSNLRALTRDKNIEPDTKKKIFQILDRERNENLPKIHISLFDTKESSTWRFF